MPVPMATHTNHVIQTGGRAQTKKIGTSALHHSLKRAQSELGLFQSSQPHPHKTYLTNLQDATGVGSFTPAVYSAWKIFSRLTLLVISLIKTGAILLFRNFLWTQRKLISAIVFTLH